MLETGSIGVKMLLIWDEGLKFPKGNSQAVAFVALATGRRDGVSEGIREGVRVAGTANGCLVARVGEMEG